jgi:hypothetical protein
LFKNLLTPKAKAVNRRSNLMDADKDLKDLRRDQLSALIGLYRRLNNIGLCLCVFAIKGILYV